MQLTPNKQAELHRALQDALDDHALAAAMPDLEPLAGTPPLPASLIEDEALHIVRHRNSGCVQFVFPANGAGASSPALVSQGWDWIVQASLRAGERMTQVMINKIEQHNKPEQLLALSRGHGQPVMPEDLAAARGRKVLLLVHGLFSSVEGGFADLDLQALLQRYEGRVFGYDHWTVAKTPQQNALNLLQRLPPDAGWELDILCHSRGGLVVRSLLTEGMADIAQARAGRIAGVGKVIFVAAANQGSPLASPDDIKQFLNVAAMLASFSRGMALDVVIGLARMVVALGYGRPSVQALATGSALIEQLGHAGTLLNAANSYYARANFDYGDSLLERTGALLNRALIDGANDLVVPYSSVLLPHAIPDDNHILNFGSAEQKQREVWHTEFFRHPATRAFITRQLG
ncbi:esterase/lipase family protein [Duganella sp. P38]|uniref:esterase/lipase family protein n=1 Tax=Duganella sp. P38 TaxID=3423949 RepID=UPI003D7A16AF